MPKIGTGIQPCFTFGAGASPVSGVYPGLRQAGAEHLSSVCRLCLFSRELVYLALPKVAAETNHPGTGFGIRGSKRRPRVDRETKPDSGVVEARAPWEG